MTDKDFDSLPFEVRMEEAKKRMEEYPDKIPIILKKNPRSNINVDKNFKYKFMVPKNHTISSFFYQIRKRMNISEEKALFFFINNSVPSLTTQTGDLYNKYKDDDLILRISFSEENTFG